MRVVILKYVALLGIACLAFSCGYGSPALGGLTGVTVNGDGDLTMVASWCGKAPDGVVVYRRPATISLSRPISRHRLWPVVSRP